MNRIIKRFLSTSRQYPAHPLVGVSCVIFKEPDYKKVVLIERGKPPKLGEWSFPGGLVNAGETIEEAARREVFEEVGLTDINIIHAASNNMDNTTDTDFTQFLSPAFTTTEHIYFDENKKCQYHYFLAQVLATTNAEEHTLKADDDVNNSNFFQVNDVINRNIGNDKMLVDRVPYVMSKAAREISKIK